LVKADYNRILYTVSRHNVVPLTSACNFDCVFCSHKQNPQGIEVFDLPHMSLEMYRDMLDYIDPNQKIVIGESSTRIIEGEPFCRKDAIEILCMIRKKHRRVPIMITTNGSLLDSEGISVLKKLMPIEINLSLNYLSQSIRKAFLGDPGAKAVETALMLSRCRIPYNGSIVAIGFDDWRDELRKTISFLDKSGAMTIRVLYTGYSKLCRRSCIKLDYTELYNVVDNIGRLISTPVILEPAQVSNFDAQVDGVVHSSPADKAGIKNGDQIIRVNGIPVVSRVDAFNRVLMAKDPLVELVRDGRPFEKVINKDRWSSSGLVFRYDIDPQQMQRIIRAIDSSRSVHPAVITSTMAYSKIDKFLKMRYPEYGIKTVKVENRFFGGNIACAGLMTVEDIIESAAFYGVSVTSDLVVMPHIAFDHTGRDITGESYNKVADALGVPVQLV
jgi:hypothetical protein